MIVTTGCGPLFDAFVAAGLNTKQLMQDLGSIVQNEQVGLSHHEVEDWAEEATHKLLKMHREQLVLITNTLHALRAMDQNK